jgi:hypothetical protein
MEVNQETIILGLVILVVVLVLLNRSNEGFRDCTTDEFVLGKRRKTGCYDVTKQDGQRLGAYCNSLNADWTTDRCPQTQSKERRRCNCLTTAELNAAKRAMFPNCGVNSRFKKTPCYVIGTPIAEAVSNHCNSINGTWTTDGCLQSQTQEQRRCTCITKRHARESKSIADNIRNSPPGSVSA